MATTKKTVKNEMKTFNNTDFTIEQVDAMPIIGITISEWRQRRIKLRLHPVDDTRVISDGIAFDETMRVIADESREAWAVALDYIEHGQIWVSK